MQMNFVSAENLRLLLTTVASADDARRLASALLERRLAACVNILPAVESHYRWQGNVESATELLLLCKTTVAHEAALAAAIRELHPYEVPEILSLQPHHVFDLYAHWVRESVL